MRPDDDSTLDGASSGRDPLEPEELAAPPEPPEPERRKPAGAAPAPEQLKEPPRLRETSVRRIDHRGEELEDDDFSAAPAETVATLGETLATERRRQGKTLADVEGATRIRGRLIEALEHGDYEALPSPAYVKGYIQSYASYLEVPGGPLIAQYNAETEGKGPKPDEHPYIKAPVAVARTLPSRRIRDRATGGGGPTPAVPARVWIWIVVIAVAVLAIIGVARLLQRSDTTIPPLPKTPPATKPSTTATKTPSGIATTSSAGATTSSAGVTTSAGTATRSAVPTYPVPPAGDFTVQVFIKSGQSSLLRIRSDGVIKYDATFQGGDTKTVFAKDTASVRSDTPAAIVVKLNGKDVPIPQPDSTGGVTIRLTKP